MGHLREKYTRDYFLGKDGIGVAGIEEFNKGDIRAHDKAILDKVGFNGRTVLDLGCGRGEAMLYALRHGAKIVYGVDFSFQALLLAKEYLGKWWSLNNYKLFSREIESFIDEEIFRKTDVIWEKHSFDMVLMLDVFEHIPKDELKVILGKLKKIITKDCLLVTSTPLYKENNDLTKEELKEICRDSSDKYEMTKGMHCTRFCKEGLQTFMVDCGWHSISESLQYWKVS